MSEYEDIGWHIWVGVLVTVVPATILVCTRFVAQIYGPSAPGLGIEDWMILASLITNWAMAGVRFYQVSALGYGHHASVLPPEDVMGFQKSFLAVQELYFLNAVLTKNALLVLFYRVFGVSRKFTFALCVAGVLIISYFLVCVVLSVVGCEPVSYFWNKSGEGKCFNEIMFFRANGIANMLLDVMILALPMPMVWRLNLAVRQKLAVTGIFLLGSFTCVVSIFRILAFENASQLDPTYTTIDTAMWSSIEQSLGIMCTCLPTLRPIFRMITQRSQKNNSSRPIDSKDEELSMNRAPKRQTASFQTGQSDRYILSSVRDHDPSARDSWIGDDFPSSASQASDTPALQVSHQANVQYSTRIWSEGE